MKPLILIKIALKNFWSKRLRAFLTVIAVTIGIASIIFLISLGYGLERLVTSQVANFDAFTVIDIPTVNQNVQKIDDETIKKIKTIPNIKITSPSINLGGRIKLSNNTATIESVIQASNTEYLQMWGINLNEGNWYEGSSNEIVINTVLGKLLFGESDNYKNFISSNTDVDLIIPRDLRPPDEIEGSIVKSTKNLTIVGVVDEGTTPVAYINLQKVKDLGVTNYSSLKIKVAKNDREVINETRNALESMGYTTEYIGDTIDQIASVFSYFRIILGAFGLIALVVASLGTFNTLTISLLERIREIGLLKVLGMNSRDIYKLFITESLFIGLLGGLIGVILGLLMGISINLILLILAKQAGVEAVKLFYTPWQLAGGVSLFSLLVGFLTGWYPAHRAVATRALDAIRYE